jgi:lipid-A-disaccharide synthase-like uncharacterized protein
MKDIIWITFGYVGFASLVGRWLLQVYESKRKGKSTISKKFWLTSAVGFFILIIYDWVYLRDIVNTTGAMAGMFIVLYNLHLKGD